MMSKLQKDYKLYKKHHRQIKTRNRPNQTNIQSLIQIQLCEAKKHSSIYNVVLTLTKCFKQCTMFRIHIRVHTDMFEILHPPSHRTLLFLTTHPICSIYCATLAAAEIYEVIDVYSVTALTEAKDICRFLKPLIKHFTLLEETDFADVGPYLKPLMHVVCLVWANSRYYCNSGKIIILLKQICNLIIQQVC